MNEAYLRGSPRVKGTVVVFAGSEQDVCGVHCLVQPAYIMKFNDCRYNRFSKIEASSELRYIRSTSDLVEDLMKSHWLS